MMGIATWYGERFTLRDTGEYIVLRSKLASKVAIAFSNWDAVMDAVATMLQGLPPRMRHDLLTNGFSAEELELAFDELAGALS
jgi:hypothetical protein